MMAKFSSFLATFDIMQRIVEGYPSDIRYIIYELDHSLCAVPSFQLEFLIPLSCLALLGTVKQTKLGTFAKGDDLRKVFDGVEDISDRIDLPKTPPSAKHSEILKSIDLTDWKVASYSSVPQDAEFCVVFGRYSHDDQDPEGCKSRVEGMINIAENNDWYLYTLPIISEAQSGKDTRREDLSELLRYLQHDAVSYLLVDDVDRLARWTSLAMFLVELCYRELDVTLVNHQGVVNLGTLQGLAMTYVTGLSSDIDNRNRARRTLDSQLSKFKENYFKWYRARPLGYSRVDDDIGGVKDDVVDENRDITEVDVARAIFNLMAAADIEDGFAPIIRKVNSQFGDIFTNYEDKYYSETLKTEPKFNLNWLKRMIRNPIYVGRPTAEGESIGDQGQHESWEEPDWAIIDEDVFEQANTKLDAIEERNSQRDYRQVDILNFNDLMTNFGLHTIMSSSPYVKAHCPICDQVMVEDNKVPAGDGEKVAPVYKCDGKVRVNRAREQDEDMEDIEDDSDEESNYVELHEEVKYRKYPNSWEYFKIRLFENISQNLDEYADYLDYRKFPPHS